MTLSFCTLAIHEPYRRRAIRLCRDAPELRWVVLTDEPDDFATLGIDARKHLPTGPMAVDYLTSMAPTGEGRGAAAYHDKRFAIQAALENSDTAIYVDADSRIVDLRVPDFFPPGLCVLPVVRKSVAEHLETCGPWRLPYFKDLATQLSGGPEILGTAKWCHEALIVVTRDGRESKFFDSWSIAAELVQSRGLFSGEGGVIGLAAACAGWSVDYDALLPISQSIRHEGGGPKAI